MIDTHTLCFLADMARNPTREWLADNRNEYLAARIDITEFAGSVLQAVGSIDSRVSGANPNHRKFVGGIVSRQACKGEVSIVFRVSTDPKAIATYFVHIQQGGCYSGGGSRSPSPKYSRLLRQQMMTYTGRWRELVEGPAFRKFFPDGLSDGVQTTLAKGFARNHDAMDSLNLKGFGACRPLSDNLMQSVDAIGEVTRSFAAARPLVDFINRATTR